MQGSEDFLNSFEAHPHDLMLVMAGFHRGRGFGGRGNFGGPMQSGSNTIPLGGRQYGR